jgi:3-keto-5-aminohexanoate cleavage enzyme
MATLSMGTMNFGNEIYENTFEIIGHLSETMMANNVMPEVEIFDAGMMDTLKRMVSKGQIQEKHHVDFVLGVPGGMAGTIEDLLFLKNQLSENQAWTVTGLGRAHLPMTMHAIAMGGHVRTGIEDNIYYKKGELAVSNAQLISRVSRIAEEMGRPVATVEKTRQILGLN